MPRASSNHLVVEVGQTALVLANQHRVEAGFRSREWVTSTWPSPARTRLRVLPLRWFLARVRGAVLSEVLIKLRRHHPVQQSFLELSQQPILAHPQKQGPHPQATRR